MLHSVRSQGRCRTFPSSAGRCSSWIRPRRPGTPLTIPGSSFTRNFADRGGIKRKRPLGEVKLGVPKEIWENEKRVAQSPESVAKLKKKGFENIFVEAGAGLAANFSNKDYEKAGATIVNSQSDLYEASNFILKVRNPTEIANGGMSRIMQTQ